MTFWLIHTNIGYFQFNDEMGAPFHFLSGLLEHSNFLSMTPIETVRPTVAPNTEPQNERVDVKPHMDERTHVLGGFNTGDGRWTCDANCWCKKSTEADEEEVDEEEAADEHFSKAWPYEADYQSGKARQNYPETIDRGPDHCGHCGTQGRRRSKLKKCIHPQCQGHCDDCVDGPSCHWDF